MTWLMICDTCNQPIRGDHTTDWTATGKEIHRHPDCKNERPFGNATHCPETVTAHTAEG